MTLATGVAVGRYRLGRLLGRGGMAVVYEATDESIGRTVALKLMSPDLVDPGFAERLRNEGRMQAALDHPHAVTVYEAGTSEHGPYLAMRLVRGTTLAGLIDDGALNSARALDLLEQVAGALDAAHDAGLVHRDVKPRNVLVEDGDHAYLADFGLTRRGDVPAATATGNFMATIAYVAPEVVAGEPATPAADRYALAAMLFECLTGSTVFPRPTTTAVLYAHASEPPPRVSRRRQGVPAALDDVLTAGLAKDPTLRPARAVDLIARARAALGDAVLDPPAPRAFAEPEGGTTAAGQVTAPSRSTPPRRRPVALVVAALAGALVAGGAVALLASGDEAAAPVRAQAELPAAPAGTEPIGADLTAAGATVDCRGAAVSADAPNCTIFQDRHPGAAVIVVPRDGVVRRWGVRSASGELALSVIRRDPAGYFQIARSPTLFVDDPGPHLAPTNLAVEQGDRLALVVVQGSGVGVRPLPGATTGRFVPSLRGLVEEQSPGIEGELLLRADLEPAGRLTLPDELVGAAARSAPAGETVASERRRFTSGRRVELRIVTVGGRGALDLFIEGRRAARTFVPQFPSEVGDAAFNIYVSPDAPEQIGVSVLVTQRDSDRLLRSYFVVRGRGQGSIQYYG